MDAASPVAENPSGVRGCIPDRSINAASHRGGSSSSKLLLLLLSRALPILIPHTSRRPIACKLSPHHDNTVEDGVRAVGDIVDAAGDPGMGLGKSPFVLSYVPVGKVKENSFNQTMTHRIVTSTITSISVPKIFLLSVQFENILLFQFVRLMHVQKSYMNTKLRFQLGPGAPFLRCTRAHVVLIRHCLGIPRSVKSPPPSTSPVPCSEDHHLPLSDCEFSLLY